MGHGVVQDGHGRAVEFRFGVHKLLEAVTATWFFNPTFGEPAPIEWPYRSIDLGCERAFSRMNQAFHRMDRAALHADTTFRLLRDPKFENPDGMHIDEFAPWLSANDDIEIYLDAVVHYLYDHVNSLAATLTYLFSADGPQLGRTFYSHRKAARSGAGGDRSYSAIMRDATGWFDTLAATVDDPQPGVRTMLVHGLERGERDFRQHYAEQMATLRTIVHEYMGMLEHLDEWLSNRLTPLAAEGSQLALVMATRPCFMTYTPPAEGPALFSHWLFPTAAEAAVDRRAERGS